jgi:putative ABC transport system permease protein
MIKSFIITSLRYLIRNKWITLINIIGLTFGITFSLLIGLYVKRELSIDKSFKDRDRIYRLEFQRAEKQRQAVTVSAIGSDLKNNFPGIESVLRIQFTNKLILKNDNEEYITIQKVCLADSTFFDFFEQEWVYGNAKNTLSQPRSLVLTDDLAVTIFGNTNPVGKTLKSQSGKSIFTITGVIRKTNNSHIPYDALLSMVTIGLNNPTILNTYDTHQWSTYFKFGSSVDPRLMEKDMMERLFAIAPNYVNREDDKDLKLVLTPLAKIYFDRDVSDIEVVHGNYNLVKVFLAIAILIIVIACINYINLSTAKALKRAKEVGLKKLVGSARSSLIAQFLAESFVISIVSTFLGVAFAEYLLPHFSNLIGTKIVITYLDNPYTIPFLIIIILLTGLIAGLYPAYYISSCSALQSIRAEFSKGKRSVGFRRGLILLQFFIAVMLINGSLLINKQLKYTNQKDLGFNKDQILTIQMNAAVYNNRSIIREQLMQNPEIINVSSSYTIPGSYLNYEGFKINNAN